MKGPVAVISVAILSVIAAVAVRLYGPAWYVTTDAASLAVMGGMAPLLTAVLTPATWWRR